MDDLVELVLDVVVETLCEAVAAVGGDKKAPRPLRLALAGLGVLVWLVLCGVGVLLLWVGADTGKAGLIATGCLMLACMAVWAGSTVYRVRERNNARRRGPDGPALSAKEGKNHGRTDSDRRG